MFGLLDLLRTHNIYSTIAAYVYVNYVVCFYTKGVLYSVCSH